MKLEDISWSNQLPKKQGYWFARASEDTTPEMFMYFRNSNYVLLLGEKNSKPLAEFIEEFPMEECQIKWSLVLEI